MNTNIIDSNREYNENYYINRKKILQEFFKDEESETMKFIEDTENLVTNTKVLLQGIVSGELEFSQVKDKLVEIDTDLNRDCNSLENEIEKLVLENEQIEKESKELQIKEEKGTEDYHNKIDKLKEELESKEFTIQNMERLYVEVESIIKENSRKGKETLLSLEEFDNYVKQNERLQEECNILENDKNRLLDDYNNLLRENLNLKSKDESFEVEKIKDVLDEIATMGSLHKEAERRIQKLQDKYTSLAKECNTLTDQIKSITKTLEGLNIDNPKLKKEISIIKKELYPFEQRLNRSFTQGYENEEWKDIEPYIPGKNNKPM